jgi:apolipoprotein N-acyltransferase
MRKFHFFLLSLLSGIVLSLPWIIQAPGCFLFFAFLPLFYAEKFRTTGGTLQNSFILSYPTFFIWNVLSTWWIAYVSLPGMLFIVAANAFLMSFVWWAGNQMKRVLGLLPGYFSLIVFWMSFEFLSHRGVLPWPWLTLGNGFANSIRFVQWYEFTGVLGGSLWILLVNVLIFEAFNAIKQIRSMRFVRLIISLFAILLFPVLVSLYLYLSYAETGKTQHVLVLQPNIDPYTKKFSGMSGEVQMTRLMQLTEQSMSDSTDLILAPETALPIIWEDSLFAGNEGLNEIRTTIQPYPNISFIAGAITKRKNYNSLVPIGNKSMQSRSVHNSYNSAVLINAMKDPQFSHKTILVAGVEKAPFREYFTFLSDFLLDPGGSTGELSPGEEPMLFKTKSGELVGPVICFESVFGNYVRQLVVNGAGCLVVLTNDGWWKQSAGVWQHFGYAKIRAIETRRSIIRSANTGISGCINQRGDILSSSKVYETCVIKCDVCLNHQLTFYVIYGDYLGKWSLLLSLFIVWYGFIYRRKDIKNPH